MLEQEKKIIFEDMKDVIETTRGVRNHLLDDKLTPEEKKADLEYMKYIIFANKNIVSASSVKISADKVTSVKPEEK